MRLTSDCYSPIPIIKHRPSHSLPQLSNKKRSLLQVLSYSNYLQTNTQKITLKSHPEKYRSSILIDTKIHQWQMLMLMIFRKHSKPKLSPRNKDIITVRMRPTTLEVSKTAVVLRAMQIHPSVKPEISKPALVLNCNPNSKHLAQFELLK